MKGLRAGIASVDDRIASAARLRPRPSSSVCVHPCLRVQTAREVDSGSGVRVAEGAALEMRCAGNRTEGSNPSRSDSPSKGAPRAATLLAFLDRVGWWWAKTRAFRPVRQPLVTTR